MNSSTLIFLASPEFTDTGHMAVGFLVLFTLVPIFVFNAFRGFSVLLGILQLIFIFSMEAAQWRFSRRGHSPIRMISAVVTYLVSNLVFSLGSLALAVLWPKLVSN